MAILTFLVIATIIVAGAYVGYHAWEKSLHEEDYEKHSESIEFSTMQVEPPTFVYTMNADQNFLIS